MNLSALYNQKINRRLEFMIAFLQRAETLAKDYNPDYLDNQIQEAIITLKDIEDLRKIEHLNSFLIALNCHLDQHRLTYIQPQTMNYMASLTDIFFENAANITNDAISSEAALEFIQLHLKTAFYFRQNKIATNDIEAPILKHLDKIGLLPDENALQVSDYFMDKVEHNQNPLFKIGDAFIKSGHDIYCDSITQYYAKELYWGEGSYSIFYFAMHALKQLDSGTQSQYKDALELAVNHFLLNVNTDQVALFSDAIMQYYDYMIAQKKAPVDALIDRHKDLIQSFPDVIKGQIMDIIHYMTNPKPSPLNPPEMM